jgi:magnesium chelatase family protein
MKLCKCSYLGHPTIVCGCAEGEIQKYRSRLSGPLLDRIDLHLTLAPVTLRTLGSREPAEQSATIRARVEVARECQCKRYAAARLRVTCNAQVSGRMILDDVSADSAELLHEAAEQMSLSARGYYRVLKVARTIADLALEQSILPVHVAEALRYRPQLTRESRAALTPRGDGAALA